LVRLIRQRNDLFIYNARLLTVSLLQWKKVLETLAEIKNYMWR
jgi:hypothetical protein